jgi:two-component system osmolarity sensor histidine kinase EnvZ
MKIHALLPNTLFGRMMLIIMTPMILVQVVTILIFYERHWDTVTRYMASNLAADMAVIIDKYAENQSPENFTATRAYAWEYFNFEMELEEGGILKRGTSLGLQTYAGEQFTTRLDTRFSYPHEIDLESDPDRIAVFVQFPEGVVTIKAGRKRIFSSTSILVILWTVSASVLLFGIALIFMRKQIRPIISLARAARQLGLGRPAPDYRLEGAREVRLAGRAFQAMRQRIHRQMVERTEMLAGVSHDLRTPLTRMKLQLEYLPEGAEREGLKKDILEMETMIEGYINFASNAMAEETQDVDLVEIINDSISSLNPKGDKVRLVTSEQVPPKIPLRRQSIRRTVDNIINNAMQHSSHCEVSIEMGSEQVQIIIDDDGPGIPKDQRTNVLRPFVRLANDEIGTDHNGSGLGLSIASDAAISHGGNLLLGESPLGGLRVRIQLPV